MGPFSFSWALGAESAMWLREDHLAGWLGSRRQCSWSKERPRWCQSPLPWWPSRYQSPYPSPQWSHPADEWFNHPLKDLHLQPRSHESWSRAWPVDAPTPTEEKQWRKKQIRFDVDEELGDDPTLPPGLTLFLAEGMAKEQDDAPSCLTPMPVDSPWPPPSKGPLHHSDCTGGAWPKVPTKLSTAQLRSWSRPKGGPDLVNHPCWWVLWEMNRIGGHPDWWKEIRASGRRIHYEGVLHQCWGLAPCPMAGGGIQTAPCPTRGFGLVGCPTLAQQAMSSGFHAKYGCHWHYGFPDCEAGEDPGLGPCTVGLNRRIWALTRVLCNSARELQRCVASLMFLSRD